MEDKGLALGRIKAFLGQLPYFPDSFDEDYILCVAKAIYDECALQVGAPRHAPSEELRDEIAILAKASRRQAPEVRTVMDSLAALVDSDHTAIYPSVGARDSEIRVRHKGIRRAVQCIEKRYPDALTVEALAKEAYLSKSHFSAVFKRETGLTPHELLRKVRIEAAMRMIRAGKDVTETCHAVGFTSMSGFEDAFCALVRMKPIEYRLSAQA